MSGRGRKKRNKTEKKDGFEAWGGYMAAKQSKLMDQFHETDIEKVSNIFNGVRILVNGLTHPSSAELKNLMAAHGGEYHMYQTSGTTHIIASNLPNVKIKHLGAVPVVKPAWIVESIALNKLLDYKRYLLYTNQSRLQPAISFPSGISKSTEIMEMAKEQNLKSTVPTDTSTSSTKTASDPKFLEEFYGNSRLHLISTLGAEFKQLIGRLREKSTGQFPDRQKLNRAPAQENPPSNIVMHIDMDCFFVSVGLRKHPELRNQPLAITHARNGIINSTDPSRQAVRDQEFALYEERHPDGAPSRIVDIKEKIDGLASMSEIASCSYEARKYGIRNGMFLGQAVKLCPELKTLPYDFEGYREVSNTLYNTIASYTLDIEAVSCDEMYVDVKPILMDTGMTVEEWATHIRNEIMTNTGCPCSTGFGANRLQARLATRKAKPAGQYYLRPENVEEYMSEIPLGDLPGVGRATVAKLRNLGFSTCGDLQNGSVKILQAELGNKLGEKIWEQAHGNDSKPLDFNHERKSVSAEVNYGIRFKTKEECYNFLRSLSNEVFSRLSDINMKAKGLTLKLLVRAEGAPVETAKFLGHGVCDAITKSSTSNIQYSNADFIFKEAKTIYDKLNLSFEELRGVGIQLTKLEKNCPVNKALANFLKKGPDSNSTTNKSDIIESDLANVAKIAQNESQNVNPERAMKQNFVVPKNKKPIRGKRGKKLATTPTRTLQNFFTQEKGDSNPKTFKNEINLKKQIDLDVLNELPDDIREEVIKEYGINLNNERVSEPETPRIDVEEPDEVATTPVEPLPISSPFSNQSWEEIKKGIKVWVQSQETPADIDVEMLGDYLRQLALDRRIEILPGIFNFLHRNFSSLTCPWHRAYFLLIDAVQLGMVATYGRGLYIEKTTFQCCQVN